MPICKLSCLQPKSPKALNVISSLPALWARRINDNWQFIIRIFNHTYFLLISLQFHPESGINISNDRHQDDLMCMWRKRHNRKASFLSGIYLWFLFLPRAGGGDTNVAHKEPNINKSYYDQSRRSSVRGGLHKMLLVSPHRIDSASSAKYFKMFYASLMDAMV